jgi:hypothetical protein
MRFSVCVPVSLTATDQLEALLDVHVPGCVVCCMYVCTCVSLMNLIQWKDASPVRILCSGSVCVLLRARTDGTSGNLGY